MLIHMKKLLYSPTLNHPRTGKLCHTAQSVTKHSFLLLIWPNRTAQRQNCVIFQLQIFRQELKIMCISSPLMQCSCSSGCPALQGRIPTCWFQLQGCSLAAKTICQWFLWLLFLLFGKSRGRVIFWKYLHWFCSWWQHSICSQTLQCLCQLLP